jgi:hypothetical protein
MLRRVLGRLLVAVDSEGVLLFQIVFYLIFILIGFHDLVIAHNGPMTLHNSMSYLSIKAWCWANMIGPAACLLGKLIEMISPTPGYEDLKAPGRVLQLGGDLTISVALMAYVVATFQVEPWGTGGYGGYVSLATWISTVVLVIRDLRRLAGKPVAL